MEWQTGETHGSWKSMHAVSEWSDTFMPAALTLSAAAFRSASPRGNLSRFTP